jgi:hypothetical protein
LTSVQFAKWSSFLQVATKLDKFSVCMIFPEAIRDRVACKPIGTDPSQAEDIAGFGSRAHGATNGDISLQARIPARVYLP